MGEIFRFKRSSHRPAQWQRNYSRHASSRCHSRRLSSGWRYRFAGLAIVMGLFGVVSLFEKGALPSFVGKNQRAIYSATTIDCDSIRTADEEIRLIGIDAPDCFRRAAMRAAANGDAAVKPIRFCGQSSLVARSPALPIRQTATGANSPHALLAQLPTMERPWCVRATLSISWKGATVELRPKPAALSAAFGAARSSDRRNGVGGRVERIPKPSWHCRSLARDAAMCSGTDGCS